ncbi:MAG TPA: cyclopropane-fatty-acyl-phospholipid synthase family protein [Pirellulales bacterium]
MNRVAQQSPSEPREGPDSTVVERSRALGRRAGSARSVRPQPVSGVTNLERWLLRRVLQRLGNPPLRITLWNDESIESDGDSISFTLRVRDRRMLWKLLSDPRFQFGEGYAARRLEVEGDLPEFLLAIDRSLLAVGEVDFGVKGFTRWLHKPHRATLAQSRENVYHHYDIGNDFYRLWLDEQLLYTCAYFAEPTMTLEQAQVAKMDHVCRKVWLRPGEEVIEAGCGWGALALHMAGRYGVRVRAFNASHEQILFAREQARREGLDNLVEFVEDDWRNITGSCDAFVSVGMLEHVGRENYATLGDVVHRCLRPNGRGLIHSIGRNRPHPTDPWIERRIFPGAYPPAMSEMTTIFEPRGFSILDMENLRLHYAQTLDHWLARFETARDEVARLFDERFVRMWRLYLAGSLAAFRSGCLQLFQIVFAPGSNHELPRTRSHQYGDGKPESFFIPAPAETPPCSDATC